MPLCLSLRFTADVRSVLSRNLHQHRLWWLAVSRGTRLVDWPLPLYRLPPCPPLPHRQPTSPLWASQTCPEERRAEVTAYDGMNSTGSPKSRNYWGERGSQLFFFFFLILYLYFFPKQMEPFCLIAPDTDCVCVRRWVGVCLLNSLVLFKLFLKIWEVEREGSAKQQRQFYISISSSPSSPDNLLVYCLDLLEQLSRRK